LLLLHLFVSFPFFLFVFRFHPLVCGKLSGFYITSAFEKKTAFVLRSSPLFCSSSDRIDASLFLIFL
jgi:hypothetical protein